MRHAMAGILTLSPWWGGFMMSTSHESREPVNGNNDKAGGKLEGRAFRRVLSSLHVESEILSQSSEGAGESDLPKGLGVFPGARSDTARQGACRHPRPGPLSWRGAG